MNNQDLCSQNKVTIAEVMVSNFILQQNLPLATADHLGPYLKVYLQTVRLLYHICSSARTKTAMFVNEAFGTHWDDFIIRNCQNYLYNCGTDGSIDTGTQKMNQVSIRICDFNTSKVVTKHFYNMCLTGGEHGTTARSIFAAIENNFDNISFQNCVSLNIDNASTMVGKRNSLASYFKDKNSEIFISGCSCQLAHIVASYANDAFSEVLDLNVENVWIDISYWFDKNSKQKGKLNEYFQFCDQEY